MRKPEFNLEMAACCPVIMITLMSFLGVGVFFFSIFMPLWAAIPLGIFVGVAAFGGLCVQGNPTVIDLGCQCIIFLVLIAIMIPVFIRARDNARKKQLRQEQKIQKQIQQPNPSP